MYKSIVIRNIKSVKKYELLRFTKEHYNQWCGRKWNKSSVYNKVEGEM